MMVMSVKEVASLALGTIEEWLDGYTEPDESSYVQHRIKVLDSDADSVLISVEEHRMGPVEPERFRVTVSVREEE